MGFAGRSYPIQKHNGRGCRTQFLQQNGCKISHAGCRSIGLQTHWGSHGCKISHAWAPKRWASDPLGVTRLQNQPRMDTEASGFRPIGGHTAAKSATQDAEALGFRPILGSHGCESNHAKHRSDGPSSCNISTGAPEHEPRSVQSYWEINPSGSNVLIEGLGGYCGKRN